MEPPAKSPSELFADILRVGRVCSSAVGVDTANPNFRINWITRVVFLVASSYFVCTGITMAEKFGESWVNGLEVACMSASALQGIVKLFTGILYTKDISEMSLLLQDLYKEYEKKGPKYRTACYKCCSSVRKILIFIGWSYIVLAITIIILPFVFLALTGKHYLIMQFHVPGLDVRTNFGYGATLVVHFISMFVGSFGLFAGDIFVLIYLSQSFLFADIMSIKVEQLNEVSTMWENETKDEHCTKLLLDLIEWHQLYSQFTQRCNDVYYYLVSAQVISAAAAILLTLVVVMAGDWPAAYAFLAIMVYSMYVYCVLGTKIEICNDQICFEIYNISWYNLTVTQQKMVRLMLMKAQTPNMLDVAGIMPLSVSTALQITKSIYSIYMMMVQFLF